MKCLLCGFESQIIQGQWKIYQCAKCKLVFKDQQYWLDLEQQKKRYSQHQNCGENYGYINSLKVLLEPLSKLTRPQNILDWGSGPNPEFSKMLKVQFVDAVVDIYDPIYQSELATKKYDLITCTEVIEHFQNPQDELEKIFTHLKPSGIFAGLTNFVDTKNLEQIQSWWYLRDQTHWSFYSEETMKFIAQKFALNVLLLSNPVFVFQKVADQ